MNLVADLAAIREGELDQWIVGAAELDDRPAVADRVDDRRLGESVGEHQRGRASERRIGDPGARPGSVVVAAADRRDVMARVQLPIPQGDRRRGERALDEVPLAGDHLEAVDLAPVGVGVTPRAPDACAAEIERGVVDDEHAVLRGHIGEDTVDRAALVADPVIDVRAGPDRVAVASIGRDLGAAQEQEPAEHRLDRGDQRVLRVGVVIAQVDEVEAAAGRQRRDLDQRRRRVAALLGVHVEVALVPAALRRQHGRRERRLREDGQGGVVAADDIDRVVTAGRRIELGLADGHGPGARRDRAGEVAPRGLRDADDRILGVAAAPAAKPLGAPHAPVEDHELGAIRVRDLDLDGARRYDERDVGVVTAGDRDIALVVHLRQHHEDRPQHGPSVLRLKAGPLRAFGPQRPRELDVIGRLVRALFLAAGGVIAPALLREVR